MSKSALKPLESLAGEIKTLIEQSRQQVAVTANATMTMLYWQIGRRINQEVLTEQRDTSRISRTAIGAGFTFRQSGIMRNKR